MSVIRPASRGSSLALRSLVTSAPRRWWGAIGPAIGFAGGLAAAAGLLFLFMPPGPSAQPTVGGVGEAPQMLQRLDRVEAGLAAATVEVTRAAGLATRAEALARRSAEQQALVGPTGDRFLAAALLLQSGIASPRPWLREYQALAALAPEGALPRPLAEVLASHATRGLPTEAELRERFAAMAP